MNATALKQTFSNNEQFIQKLVANFTTANRDSFLLRATYHTPGTASIKAIKAFEIGAVIKGFRNLQQNWDTYNADPVSLPAISTALEVLSQLENDGMFSQGISIQVFPMRNGGIQYEFDAENLSAELEIDFNGEMMFILFDDQGNEMERNAIYNYELSAISNFLKNL